MKNYIIFAVIAAVIIAGAMMYKSNRSATTEVVQPTQQMPIQGSTEPEMIVINSKPITMENGLIIEDVKLGSGDVAVKGALISVHYVGTLTNGTKFDSSRDRGEPFQFPLGQGMVIQGWEQGFEGMKIGGVRKLTIPPSLGYGAQNVGPIPANSTLHFEVELLGVRLK